MTDHPRTRIAAVLKLKYLARWADMADDLRTRIAAAIYNACDDYTRKLMVRPDCPGASEVEGDGKPVCYVLADAVIRELGLRKVTDVNRSVPQSRYVTEWEVDE